MTATRTTATVEAIEGDCLDVLTGRTPGQFDLACLDPPFNTGGTRRGTRGAYRDHWPHIEAYLEFLRPRVAAVFRALKPDGAILLHCDWRTSHHVRGLLDELFGAERFINHLIWTYGLGGSSPRRFARKHDDILYYARSDDYYFEPPRVPASSNRMKGQLKKATDVLDIPSLNNMAAERVGYPTQKPLALLELLVTATCPPGGLVVDPFCGSGTTIVAAVRTGRGGLGIDTNPEAIEITRARLSECRETTGTRGRG